MTGAKGGVKEARWVMLRLGCYMGAVTAACEVGILRGGGCCGGLCGREFTGYWVLHGAGGAVLLAVRGATGRGCCGERLGTVGRGAAGGGWGTVPAGGSDTDRYCGAGVLWGRCCSEQGYYGRTLRGISASRVGCY